MSAISVQKIKPLLTTYIDTQVIPNITSPMRKAKVIIAGVYLDKNFDTMAQEYLSTAKQAQLMDADGRLSIDAIKDYINPVFEHIQEVPLTGFLDGLSLTKQDADALFKLLEDNKDV